MFEKFGLVAFAAFALVMLFLFNRNFQRNFEEQVIRDQLLVAANAASDTSTEYMLFNSEETPSGLIIIDPEYVWYVYKYTFLEALGLNSRSNLAEVEHFFPSVIIAVNDGYYMRTSVLTNELPNIPAQWEYRFGHKVPYARMNEVATPTFGVVNEVLPGLPVNASGTNPTIPASTASNPVIVADTMNGKNINVFYPYVSNAANLPHYGGMYGRWVRYALDGRSTPPVAVRDVSGRWLIGAHHPPSIAREILRALDALMRWNAGENSQYRQGGELVIPTEVITNFTSENVTFVGPMVLAIADNFSWLGNQVMSFWTISNTQIVEAPRVYVYRVRSPELGGTEVFLYSYCDPHGRDIYQVNMLHTFIYNPNATAGNERIWQIFNSQDAAALYGAYPDMRYADLCS